MTRRARALARPARVASFVFLGPQQNAVTVLLKFARYSLRPLHLACSLATIRQPKSVFSVAIDSNLHIAQPEWSTITIAVEPPLFWSTISAALSAVFGPVPEAAAGGARCRRRTSLLCALRRRLRAGPGGGGGGAHCRARTSLLFALRRRLRAGPGGGCGEARCCIRTLPRDGLPGQWVGSTYTDYLAYAARRTSWSGKSDVYLLYYLRCAAALLPGLLP